MARRRAKMGRWHGRTPDWEPESEEDYEVARSELKRRFAAMACGRRRSSPMSDAGEAPIHYKWAYVDGHLTRWRRRDLDEIYLELYPAKVMVEDDDLDEVLDEAKTFITFLAETGLLDADSESGRRAGRPSRRDRDAVPPQHGRRLALQLRQAAVDEARRPKGSASTTRRRSRRSWPTSTPGRRAERDAILGRGLPADGRPPPGRFTPPGTRPKAPSAKRRKRRR